MNIWLNEEQVRYVLYLVQRERITIDRRRMPRIGDERDRRLAQDVRDAIHLAMRPQAGSQEGKA